MPTNRVYDTFDWPVPYPNIPRNGREMSKGFSYVWGQVVKDIEALEAAEIASRNNIAVRLSVDEQQALFRIAPHASWLYFLYSKDSGLVKIGKTTCPQKRMACLYTMSPVPLECIALVRSHDLHEGMLHKALAKYRSHGEWFRLEGDVLEVAKKARSDGIQPVHEFICRMAVDSCESIG